MLFVTVNFSITPPALGYFVVQGVVLAVAYSLSKEGGYEGVYQRAMSSLRLAIERVNKPEYQRLYSYFFETLPDFTESAEEIYDGLKRCWSTDDASKNIFGPLKVLFDKYITGKKPAKRRKSSKDINKTSQAPVPVRNIAMTSMEDDGVEFIEYGENPSVSEVGVIDPEQQSDEGRRQRYLEVKMIAPESVARSLTMKKRQAKAVINQLVRREKLLLTEWSKLTHHEVKRVASDCLNHVESGERSQYSYRYVLLMLFTGRSLASLCAAVGSSDEECRKLSGGSDGSVTITVESSLPEHVVVDKVEPVLRRSQTQFLLYLPDFLHDSVRAVCNDERSIAQIKSGVDRLIDSFHLSFSTRISKDRLARYFGDWLANKGVDSVEINWLLGAELSVFEAGMYYSQIPVQRLQNIYGEYVAHLLKLANRPMVPCVEVRRQGYIGSQLFVEQIRVSKLLNALRYRVEALSHENKISWGSFHNTYTLYTVLLLNYSTGGRPTRSIYDSLQAFDCISGTVFIDDKAIGGSEFGRQLVLPDIALEQLTPLHRLP